MKIGCCATSDVMSGFQNFERLQMQCFGLPLEYMNGDSIFVIPFANAGHVQPLLLWSDKHESFHLIGGKREYGESWHVALVREIVEESPSILGFPMRFLSPLIWTSEALSFGIPGARHIVIPGFVRESQLSRMVHLGYGEIPDSRLSVIAKSALDALPASLQEIKGLGGRK